jgi:hypothetical protein
VLSNRGELFCPTTLPGRFSAEKTTLLASRIVCAFDSEQKYILEKRKTKGEKKSKIK